MDYIDKLIQSCESYMITDDDIITESATGLAVGLIAISVISGSVALAAKKLLNNDEIKKLKDKIKQKSQVSTSIAPKQSTPRVSAEIGKKLLSDAYLDIQKIVKEYQKNPEIKSHIKSLIDKFAKEAANDGNPMSKSDLQFKLICDIFEESNEELIVEIIDGSQEIRITLGSIVYDIANAISIKYPQLNVETGDGDEGCIYLNY